MPVVIIAYSVYYVPLPRRAEQWWIKWATYNKLYHQIFFLESRYKSLYKEQSTKYTNTSIVPADGIKMIAQKLSWLAWGLIQVVLPFKIT